MFGFFVGNTDGFLNTPKNTAFPREIECLSTMQKHRERVSKMMRNRYVSSGVKKISPCLQECNVYARV